MSLCRSCNHEEHFCEEEDCTCPEPGCIAIRMEIAAEREAEDAATGEKP